MISRQGMKFQKFMTKVGFEWQNRIISKVLNGTYKCNIQSLYGKRILERHSDESRNKLI